MLGARSLDTMPGVETPLYVDVSTPVRPTEKYAGPHGSDRLWPRGLALDPNPYNKCVTTQPGTCAPTGRTAYHSAICHLLTHQEHA